MDQRLQPLWWRLGRPIDAWMHSFLFFPSMAPMHDGHRRSRQLPGKNIGFCFKQAAKQKGIRHQSCLKHLVPSVRRAFLHFAHPRHNSAVTRVAHTRPSQASEHTVHRPAQRRRECITTPKSMASIGGSTMIRRTRSDRLLFLHGECSITDKRASENGKTLAGVFG